MHFLKNVSTESGVVTIGALEPVPKTSKSTSIQTHGMFSLFYKFTEAYTRKEDSYFAEGKGIKNHKLKLKVAWVPPGRYVKAKGSAMAHCKGHSELQT